MQQAVENLSRALCDVFTEAGTREVGTVHELHHLPFTDCTDISLLDFAGHEIDAINRKLKNQLGLSDSALTVIGQLLRRLPCNDRPEHRAFKGYRISDLALDLHFRVASLRLDALSRSTFEDSNS